MPVHFKVFRCRSPKELFSGVRAFRVHEVSPPEGLLMYWGEGDRYYFPFRPRRRVWYYRPRLKSAETGRFALYAKCWSGQPNTKLVVEVA